MSLAFHACPPPGAWFNDPCGLVRDAGGWTLLVQHRADAPAFARVGWGRLTSPDLLDWRWRGSAIAPEPDASIYSGCIRRGPAGWQAVHTLHDDASGLQAQVRRRSADGAAWGPPEELVAARADRRDPFIVRRGGATLMLLAEPPGWTPAPGARAQLSIWRETGRGWEQTGVIGPWARAGVLWEMPCVIARDGSDLLIVSEVDRFDGSSRGRVRVWRGVLSATGFALADGQDEAGALLDLGPEFYAAVPGAGHVVGWLSSWRIARRMNWPGFAGGPISLPRRIGWRDGAVRIAPPAGLARAFPRRLPAPPRAGVGVAQVDGRAPVSLTIRGDGAEACVVIDPASGTIAMSRGGPDWLACQMTHRNFCTPVNTRRLMLVVDGPVLELFLAPEGRVLSMILPDSGSAFNITLEGDRPEIGFDWRGRG